MSQQEDFNDHIPNSRVLCIFPHWANAGEFTAGTMALRMVSDLARQGAEGPKLPTGLSWRKRQKKSRPAEPKIQHMKKFPDH